MNDRGTPPCIRSVNTPLLNMHCSKFNGIIVYCIIIKYMDVILQLIYKVEKCNSGHKKARLQVQVNNHQQQYWSPFIIFISIIAVLQTDVHQMQYVRGNRSVVTMIDHLLLTFTVGAPPHFLGGGRPISGHLGIIIPDSR